MSLRSALFDALSDPERLKRIHEGSVSDAAFCSRLLADVGASWLPVVQEWESLLGALAGNGWHRGGMAAAAFWYDETGRCGFVHKTSTCGSKFRSIDLSLPDYGWRGPILPRDGRQYLSCPG